MLAGIEEQKTTFTDFTLDPQKPQSLEPLDSLPQNEALALSFFIKGNLTQEVVDKLIAVLPKHNVVSFSLEVNSSDIQKNDHLIKIINLIYGVYGASFNQVNLAIKLSAEQLDLMLQAIHYNPKITAFSLKRTPIKGASYEIFSRRLEEFKRAKRKFEAFGLELAGLDTIHLVRILRTLGPLGLKSLNFSSNNTNQKGEGFDALSETLLDPQCELNVLHLKAPLGGHAENQSLAFCDTLAKIPRNFDLHLTFGGGVYFDRTDFVLLKEALFLNPRLCVYIKGLTTQLQPFQNEIEGIAVFAEKNRTIRESNDPNLFRQRYDSLVLSGYKFLWEYPLWKTLRRTVPSLQSLAAKAVRANSELAAHIASIPEFCLQALPETSMDNYEQVLRGLYNLKIIEKSDDDPQKAKQDKFNNLIRALR